jgi:hypothetical protein
MLDEAHVRAFANHTQLAADDKCGCFYCLEVFDAREIKRWVDDGTTALCPRCSIDAVLSSKTDRIDQTFLQRMHDHWFL